MASIEIVPSEYENGYEYIHVVPDMMTAEEQVRLRPEKKIDILLNEGENDG
jgi:hypothetical protein